MELERLVVLDKRPSHAKEHVLLARKFPGLNDLTDAECVTPDDGKPHNGDTAELRFESRVRCEVWTSSLEMSVAADLSNIATGRATVTTASEREL